VRRFTEWSDRYGAMVLFGLLMIGSVSNFSPLSVLIGVPRNWLAGILFNGI
jgi:hypothetical protein